VNDHPVIVGPARLFCSGVWLHARQAVVANTHGRRGFACSLTDLSA
jgi:hypothetical protein